MLSLLWHTMLHNIPPLGQTVPNLGTNSLINSSAESIITKCERATTLWEGAVNSLGVRTKLSKTWNTRTNFYWTKVHLPIDCIWSVFNNGKRDYFWKQLFIEKQHFFELFFRSLGIVFSRVIKWFLSFLWFPRISQGLMVSGGPFVVQELNIREDVHTTYNCQLYMFFLFWGVEW